MKVHHIRCGPAANESELKAIENIKNGLKAIQGDDEWILLTNLAFSLNNQFQADEIDILCLGPSFIRLIEVKHWSSQWVDSHEALVNQEADKATSKARRIGTTLRRFNQNLGFVEACFFCD